MGSPAYAGKRISKKSKRSVLEDHPRLCGEKICGKQYQIERKGSPPPMRGKGIAFPAAMRCRGITPRLCGEKEDSAGM